jgi:hypothetical protein
MKPKNQFFTDKYGITTLKNPISENDKILIGKISELLNNKNKHAKNIKP